MGRFYVNCSFSNSESFSSAGFFLATWIRNIQRIPHNNVNPAVDRNIPDLDHSINVLKIGGPIATPKKRTEPYNEVTNPLLSDGTEPVIKLLMQGSTRPVPILLTTNTAKNGNNLVKNIRDAKEAVINRQPITINFFIRLIFFADITSSEIGSSGHE
jgi:hypothetical protein